MSLPAGWTMRLPTAVELGTGALDRLPRHMTGVRCALVVTGRRAMRESGVTERLSAVLTAAGIRHEVWSGLSAEPECTEVEAAGSRARSLGAEAVIGCGGGSAMDAAKAAAVAATHPGPIMEYVAGGARQVTAATLPVFAVSSTSGTGSHVGRVAVLSDRPRRIKRSIASDFIYPRAAACDPAVLRTMPPDLTASSGFDAFVQALEGFLSSQENPLGNLCAQEAMRVIFDALPRVLADPGSLELRERMAWGDTLGGVSLATNAVVTPHAIGMVLGGRYGIPHGRAIATVAVACLRHARPGAVGKLARVAELLGCREASGDEARADQAIDAIEDFIRRIGMRKTVLEYGVDERDFPGIAEEVRSAFGARVDADPVPSDADGIAGILRASVGGA
jgi:alcohol dehydrogenase class IV